MKITDNIRDLLAKAYRWWRALPPSADEACDAVDETAATSRRPSKGHRAEKERGVFTFRRTILNDLDGYFEFIERLKTADPGAYHLHSKVGAAIVPQDTVFRASELPARWRVGSRPTFGCLSFVMGKDQTQPEDPFFKLRFGYFERWDNPPPAVQRMKGTTYSLTMFIALDEIDKLVPSGVLKRHGFGVPFEMWVCVSPDGTQITPLRIREYRSTNGIPQTTWRVHPFYVARAKERGESVDQWMSALFCMVVNGWENAALDILIRVKRGDLCAMFCIDMLRTPYFFQDRDATALTSAGKRRPIFHIVRTHRRISGRFVRTHFRGLRKFQWNGYDVSITMPGLHHNSLHDLEVGAHDEQSAKTRREKTIGPRRFGRRIARYLDAA